MHARGFAAGLLSAGLIIFGAARLGLAEAGDTLKADAARIDADIQQLQTDQQKVRTLVEPDKAAVQKAQQQLDQDTAPLVAQLKADEQKLEDLLKADREAIKAARDGAAAGIHALEAKLQADQQRAAHDKAAAANVRQDESELKDARQKVDQTVKPLEAKLQSNRQTGEQALSKEREAMKAALKSDVDALHNASQTLATDSLWQTKVDADRATLAADQQQLNSDKSAAGQ